MFFQSNCLSKGKQKKKKKHIKSNKKISLPKRGTQKGWKNFTLCPARPTPSTSTNTSPTNCSEHLINSQPNLQ